MASADLVAFASSLLLALCATYVLAPLFLAPRKIALPGSGERTREDLLLEKEAVYAAIKDADLDRQTGKLSEGDHREMTTVLKARAVELLHALDGLDAPERDGAAHRGTRRRGGS
ncbi:MAG: hypothetical protein U0166_19280 [Acidobacteriota bacterium]